MPTDRTPGRVKAAAGIFYRRMRRGDLPAVSAIEREATPFPWSREKFLDCLAAENDCWVCCREAESETEESVIGYAIVFSVLDEATLLNLCIAPAHQGQGLGRALLGYILGRIYGKGIGRVLLEVRESNARGISLYGSCGFRHIADRKNYYPALGGREDARVYVLEYRGETTC